MREEKPTKPTRRSAGQEKGADGSSWRSETARTWSSSFLALPFQAFQVSRRRARSLSSGADVAARGSNVDGWRRRGGARGGANGRTRSALDSATSRSSCTSSSTTPSRLKREFPTNSLRTNRPRCPRAPALRLSVLCTENPTAAAHCVGEPQTSRARTVQVRGVGPGTLGERTHFKPDDDGPHPVPREQRATRAGLLVVLRLGRSGEGWKRGAKVPSERDACEGRELGLGEAGARLAGVWWCERAFSQQPMAGNGRVERASVGSRMAGAGGELARWCRVRVARVRVCGSLWQG